MRRSFAVDSGIATADPYRNSSGVAAMSMLPGETPLTPSTTPTITHIIFDMDGLLLDTEKFYTEVQEIILAKHGKTFDWSLKAKMMGKKAIVAARVFVEETGLDGIITPEGFIVERESMLQEMFSTSELMPGVERLIKHFHSNGVPMCVATGSHKRHFQLKTQNHQAVFSLMHHIVTGDDPEVKNGKPSPDIFLAAAKRFEDTVYPRKILVFEDAPSGVAAAKNAGMSVVMVPDPRLDASYHEGANQVLSSLIEFDPCEWGLPPFLSTLLNSGFFVQTSCIGTYCSNHRFQAFSLIL